MTNVFEFYRQINLTNRVLLLFAFTLLFWFLTFDLRSKLMFMAIQDDRVDNLIGKPFITPDIVNKGLQHAFTLRKHQAFLSLLRNGANPDVYIFFDQRWERIGLFALRSKDSFWLESLLDYGVDLSKLKWREASPLIHTISSSAAKNAAILLDHGVELQHVGTTMTPLNYSVQMRQPKIFEMLIVYGADINFPGFSGRTFFDAFVIMGFADTDWKIDDLDPLMDDFVEAMKICNLDPNNLKFNAQPKSVGKWEFAKLRPDEDQTFDIRKPFIELRLKRPESIYNDPEKWGIVEKLKPYLPAKNVEEANPPK